MKICFVSIVSAIFLIIAGFGELAHGKETTMDSLAQEVVNAAFAHLKVSKDTTGMACLTNAGYVKYDGKSTRILYDLIQKHTGISLGKGNLMPVHSKWDDNLWFAFVQKKSPKELLLTYIFPDKQGIHATQPINICVDKHQSFEPFKKILGKRAFSIVTLANGWADGIPEDLIQGALFHDHLCCGVATGYFTVRFIKNHIPLKNGEKYTYIGAPGWCQDDYLISYLNLTPGKHGYCIMQYPWYRPWKTSGQVYDKLGGIIVRFNHTENTGQAHVLRFDWHEDEFRKFVAEPELKLDWENQPWLHVWYNKFFLRHLDQADHFISVIKVRELKSKSDFDCLVNLGANPLKEILGEDESWH